MNTKHSVEAKHNDGVSQPLAEYLFNIALNQQRLAAEKLPHCALQWPAEQSKLQSYAKEAGILEKSYRT